MSDPVCEYAGKRATGQPIRVTEPSAYTARVIMRLASRASGTGMGDHEREFTNDQKVALQRLAALQRMREQARKGNCSVMLGTLEKLIELETRLLRQSRDTDDRPGMRAGRPA